MGAEAPKRRAIDYDLADDDRIEMPVAEESKVLADLGERQFRTTRHQFTDHIERSSMDRTLGVAVR
jgi:hypothetical protein